MPQELEIQCINKSNRSNPHERITHVGGIHEGNRWKLTEDEAILAIENQRASFYVKQRGLRAEVIVATRSGKKYLKTVADGETPDNLLSLPECPALLRNPVPVAGLAFPDRPVVPNKPVGFA